MKGTSPPQGRGEVATHGIKSAKMEGVVFIHHPEGKAMTIITIGIDLAKNLFAVHGVNEPGQAELVKPKVTRDQLLPLIVQLPPCLIGMEACSGAHHWARLFRKYGHTVKLMAPKFVSPYRMSGKRGKNDAADAAALCEAVTRAHMRFVPVKEEHQQIILCLHRTRQGFIEERTATYNRLRGLMSEFGIVLPQKVACLRREIGACLEDLPGYANQCIGDLLIHADRLDERIADYDRIIAKAAREGARSQRLMERPGIGPITASAFLASIGGGHDFKNGRQVAAWIGLTPGQYSSGGTARLGRITQAGDPYLRSLLVMGARAILAGLGDKQDGFSRWAVLKYGEDFRLNASVA
jgi:transposase